MSTSDLFIQFQSAVHKMLKYRKNKNNMKFYKYKKICSAIMHQLTNIYPIIQQNQSRLYGLYYGFPKCCVEGFIDRSITGNELQKQLSNTHTFIAS